MSDDLWMRRCLQLAHEAAQRGDAPVGAVIVRNGLVLSEAGEQIKTAHDVAGHAELIAIRAACRELETMDLAGCTLYTNIEPCWMCSFAIRETGIDRVVIGVPIADIGGVTSRYPILSDAAINGWRTPPTLLWTGSADDAATRQ